MVRYRSNGWVGKLFGRLIGLVSVVVVLWLEFGGIWHAFAHYGVTDGLISVFVPPYAWYRSVQFFFWLGTKHKAKKTEAFTESEIEELNHFSMSLYLLEGLDREFKPTDEDMEKMVSQMRVILNESEQVSNATLAKLHPNLPKHYREEYCEAMRLMIYSVDNTDAKSLVEGWRLMYEWSIWYEEHWEEIQEKLDNL